MISGAVETAEPVSVLIASSDTNMHHRVQQHLAATLWTATAAMGGADALAKLEASQHEVLLLDHSLPDLHAEDLISIVFERYPQVDVLLVNAQTGQFLPPRKPPRNLKTHELFEVLLHPVSRECEESIAEKTGLPLFDAHSNMNTVEPLPGMIGSSLKMQNVYRLARLIAPCNIPVLISGETGTGKELVARGIHQLSQRACQPFVAVNCGAIPETLIESELFGFEKGSFTGASEARMGRIQAARGGTLFLDEIGELPLHMQAKLLRFLQEGEIQRIGSAETRRVDVRVIAATNANLLSQVTQGKFRSDLFYRLAVFPIPLPPLRERKEDMMPILELVHTQFSKQMGTKAPSLPLAVLRALHQHNWPGNVREFMHAVERVYLMIGDTYLRACTECPAALYYQWPAQCARGDEQACCYLSFCEPRHKV